MHRKLFFVAFIGIVALALWLTFFTLPVFNIKTIEINGNENLSKEQIESMLNTKVGNNIFAFNKTKALKNIKSNDIQRIKVGETDTYWIFVQNNSNKKITVNGVYIC